MALQCSRHLRCVRFSKSAGQAFFSAAQTSSHLAVFSRCGARNGQLALICSRSKLSRSRSNAAPASCLSWERHLPQGCRRLRPLQHYFCPQAPGQRVRDQQSTICGQTPVQSCPAPAGAAERRFPFDLRVPRGSPLLDSLVPCVFEILALGETADHHI